MYLKIKKKKFYIFKLKVNFTTFINPKQTTFDEKY